jgi:hypothetical protein
MNHGTREDKEEEDRYRTEHLVAVCRNMRWSVAEYRGCYCSALDAFNHSHVEGSDEIGLDDAIHSLQDPPTNSVIPCPIPRKSKPSVSMRPVASRSSKTSRCPSQK